MSKKRKKKVSVTHDILPKVESDKDQVAEAVHDMADAIRYLADKLSILDVVSAVIISKIREEENGGQ